MAETVCRLDFCGGIEAELTLGLGYQHSEQLSNHHISTATALRGSAYRRTTRAPTALPPFACMVVLRYRGTTSPEKIPPGVGARTGVSVFVSASAVPF